MCVLQDIICMKKMYIVVALPMRASAAFYKQGEQATGSFTERPGTRTAGFLVTQEDAFKFNQSSSRCLPTIAFANVCKS
jgi:hypothetical protein